MKWKPYSERDGIEELRKKVEHYYRACCSMNHEIIATVARSLCYEHSNEYGWNVGDHTAETLVEELVECNELNMRRSLQKPLSRQRKRFFRFLVIRRMMRASGATVWGSSRGLVDLSR